MSLALLIVAFLLTGFTSITNKALVQWHLGEFRYVYMVALYGSAMILGLVSVPLRKKKEPSTKTDMWVGLIMGSSGALSVLFLLFALQKAQGIVIFPVRSLGNLIVTALVSMIAWHEKLSKSQWLGMAISLVALWLLY
jgi:drug/metabolite transporter (DMT)-like permease